MLLLHVQMLTAEHSRQLVSFDLGQDHAFRSYSASRVTT